MAPGNGAIGTKNDPTTAVTYNLGGTYYPVLFDGTKGAAATTITLRAGWGAILSFNP
jgi:hypothetical protein